MNKLSNDCVWCSAPTSTKAMAIALLVSLGMHVVTIMAISQMECSLPDLKGELIPLDESITDINLEGAIK